MGQERADIFGTMVWRHNRVI